MNKKYLAAVVILGNILTACSSVPVVNTSTTANANRSAVNANTNVVKEKDSPASETISNGNSNSAAFPDPTKTVVSAEVLSEHFVKNKDEMDTKYSGKRLKFEGIVKEVIKNTEKGATVIIRGRKDATGFTDLHCSFAKSNPKFTSFVAEFKEGDRKAISGEFEGIMGTTTMILGKCEPIR